MRTKTGLALALGLCMVFAFGASAQDAGNEGKTRSWTTDGTGRMVKNENGTIACSRIGNITFDNGRTARLAAERLITPGKNGSATWTGVRSFTNPRGETRTATVEGSRSVTRNEDGSRTIKIGETVRLEDGRTITVDGERIVVKNADGTIAWTGNFTAKRSDDATATRSAQGVAQRNGNGFTWERTANGVNFRGLKWSSETTGSGEKTDDGCAWRSATTGRLN